MNRIFCAILAVFLTASPVGAVDVSSGANNTLGVDLVGGPGGYYSKVDRSGPYSVDPTGKTTLIGSGTDGSSGGTAADQSGTNATDGQSATTNNQHGLAFGYIYNGATWDRSRGINGVSYFTIPDIRASGSLSAAANQFVDIPLNGASTVGLKFSGLTASGAVLSFTTSNDGGTTYSAKNNVNCGTGVGASTYSADGQPRIDVSGVTNLRVTVTTGGTGNVAYSYNISAAPLACPNGPTPPGSNQIGVVPVFGFDAVGVAPTKPPVGVGFADASGNTQRVSVLAPLPTQDQNEANTITSPGTAPTKVQGVQRADGSTVAGDGTDNTGVSQPNGGTGIRGWLSAIYSKLLSGIGVTGTVTSNQGTPNTQANAWYTTDTNVSSSTATPGTATSKVVGVQRGDGASIAGDGTDNTGVSQPNGGTGIRGWLSAIYSKVAGILSVKIDQTTPGTTNGVQITNPYLTTTNNALEPATSASGKMTVTSTAVAANTNTQIAAANTSRIGLDIQCGSGAVVVSETGATLTASTFGTSGQTLYIPSGSQQPFIPPVASRTTINAYTASAQTCVVTEYNR